MRAGPLCSGGGCQFSILDNHGCWEALLDGSGHERSVKADSQGKERSALLGL